MNELQLYDGQPVADLAKRHILDIMRDYIHEVTRTRGSDVSRVKIIGRTVTEHFWDDPYPATWKRAQSRGYTAARLERGVVSASARKELAILGAALRHDVKEERLEKAPPIELPPGSEPRKRFLSEEEIRAVFRQPMSRRLRMFFRLAFATAARSRAIEELTWDRVDFEKGLIDYYVPGTRRTKKRRAVVPIADDLLRHLENARAWPDRDDWVIGLGDRGVCSSTYHEAKRVMIAAGISERGVARHVARKTFASHALLHKVPIAHVAAVLGDTVMTTERAYSFLKPEALIEAVNYRRAA